LVIGFKDYISYLKKEILIIKEREMKTELKEKAIIVDLEGTLSNHGYRKYFLKDNHFDAYIEEFINDELNVSAYDEIQKFIMENQIKNIILLTAKSESQREDVKKWLKKNNIINTWNLTPDKIIMRPETDQSLTSAQFKNKILNEHLHKYEIVGAWDDKETVCTMYYHNCIPYIRHVIISDERIKPSMPSPVDFLKMATQTFKDRDKLYGSSYKTFGQLGIALFPQGLNLKTEKDFERFGILNMILSKLHRYAHNFTEQGHADSLIDLSVYAAMLNALDYEDEETANYVPNN